MDSLTKVVDGVNDDKLSLNVKTDVQVSQRGPEVIYNLHGMTVAVAPDSSGEAVIHLANGMALYPHEALALSVALHQCVGELMANTAASRCNAV